MLDKNIIKTLINDLHSLSCGDLNRCFDEPLLGIVFVGASASGKTSAIRKLKHLAEGKSLDVFVPKRYTTRPARGNDDPQENSHLADQEFEQLVRDGVMNFSWQKNVKEDLIIRYGFKLPETFSFALFSGNNGLLKHPDKAFPPNILDRVLIIGMDASQDLRRARLLERNPEMFQNRRDEFEYRLNDTFQVQNHVDIVVHNYGEYESSAFQDIWSLVQKLV